MVNNHFDGVSAQGTLAYWEKLDDLDLSDGQKIPLTISFKSTRRFMSPYLGQGWSLALLESNIVQINEKQFLITLPNGHSVILHRKNESDMTLMGRAAGREKGSGWMAELGGNTTTLWAQCGWKIVFDNGKIDSITTPKNRLITYVYQNGIVKEIDLDGVPVLNVITDSAGTVSDLLFNNKKINFTESPKPNVENINGQNVVGEMANSLAKITFPNGTIENFKFAVDSKLQPTLDISGVNYRSFTWDPVTEHILSDGDWIYSIVPPLRQFSDAQIGRKNGSGQSEFWYNNERAGQEVTQGIDGVKLVREYFISRGPLFLKTRKIEAVKENITKVVYSASYDEAGKLIREVFWDGTTQTYDSTGTVVSITKGSKQIFSKRLDAAGRVIAWEDLARNVMVRTLYVSNDEHVDSVYSGGTLLYTRDIKNDRLISLKE